MDDRDESTHLLASLARRPIICAVSVLIFGGGCLLASMYVPIGVPFLTLAITGSVALVAGAFTCVVLFLGWLLGLRGRSARAVTEGRASILFPGRRPGPMHLTRIGRGRPSTSPAIPSDANDEVPVEEADEMVDLRQPTHQESAA